ncbi:DUF2605 domain-containing protein [[Limnothrix rosea] IAM M-220]|uniref:DUF2605 domain-containing protein n=1 Tax=[Limnothrix rosea] IAM M-220 TaxID=454133 RepID=UPI000966C328|nr:DUF2605 domain-containing protein [[Limnothrix rosea] IAM M-220]OKH19563.1 hypothetical protein NIES208_01815 [[Limnothrix rosea] IAM M-220]
MFPNDLPNDQEMLKTILAPLLDDFSYWFERSLSALEKEQVSFMTVQEQEAFMARIKQAQAEVSVAKSLFNATGGSAGIEMKVLMPWHQLVQECWGIAKKNRESKAS